LKISTPFKSLVSLNLKEINNRLYAITKAIDEGVGGNNTRKILTYGANIVLNASENFNVYRLTLNGNSDITVTNMEDMQTIILCVYKTGSGNILSVGGESITLQSGTTIPTLIGLFKDGSNILFDTNAGLGGAVAVDTTAPVVVSAEVIDANTIEIVFGENVNATDIGWAFKQEGVDIFPTGVAGTGTDTLTFTFAETFLPGETILRSYNSTTGNTTDVIGNELSSFTDQSVTNSLAAGEILLTSGTLGETAGATLSSGYEFINLKASTRVQVAGTVNRVRYNLNSATYSSYNRIRVWRKTAGTYDLVGETQNIAGPYNDPGDNEEIVDVPFAVQVGDYVGMILGSGTVDTAAPSPGVSDMAFVSGIGGVATTDMAWDANGAGDSSWGAAYIELVQD
jgi:hypothetical protein